MNCEAIRSFGLAYTIQLEAGQFSFNVLQGTGGSNTPCITEGEGYHPSTLCSTLQSLEVGSHKPIFYVDCSDSLDDICEHEDGELLG